MRRALIAVVGISILLVPLSSSAESEWRLTPGGWVSGGVEYMTTIPFDAGTAIDAVLEGDFLYVTSWRSLSIYDVSEPLSPRLLTQIPTPAQLINENPETNGEILLLSNDNTGRTLDIYDVTDKAAPTKIGAYADTLRNHIWECVLGCRYAYGATGTILDLSDPTHPTKVGDWTATKKPTGLHAIEEVAPGLVLTGSVPMLLLDARTDPANPRILTEIGLDTTSPPKPYVIIGGHPNTVPARVDWPLGTKSRYLLVSMESPFSGDCSDQSGGFISIDTHRWDKKKKKFKGFLKVDEYRMTTNGLPSEGSAPVNLFGCSSYGFDVNPAYASNGLAATAWFEHGTRILRVGSDGRFSEVGGFLGHGGTAQATVWRNENVVYVIDFERGIDILSVPQSSLS